MRESSTNQVLSTNKGFSPKALRLAVAAAVLPALLAASGCMVQPVHPEIIEPESAVVGQITERLEAYAVGSAEQSVWWEGFESEQLNALVDQALRNNRDLKVTALRLDAALARLNAVEDQRNPQGGLYSNLAVDRAQLSGQDDASTQKQISAGVSVQWSADLFGRIESSIRAAQAGIEKQRYAKDRVTAEIVTGVVDAYTRLAGTEMQLRVLEEQLQSLNHTVDTLDLRVNEGFATPLELYRAKVLRYEFEAKRPIIAEQAALYRSSLATLVGVAVPELHLAAGGLNLPEAQAVLPMLQHPQQTLLAAPELMEARAAIYQRAAITDQANAALYPDLRVSGLIGWLSAGTLNLGDGDENLRVAPQLQWSLLNLSALRANLQATQVEEVAQVAAYEKVLLQVLNQADRAVKTWSARSERLAHLEQRHFYAVKALEQAEVRYEEGAIPYVEFLDAQRDLLTAEDVLVLAKIDWSMAYTDLQRSFTGSWLPGVNARVAKNGNVPELVAVSSTQITD